jgi:AcrR family transcriptional regulator
MPGKHKKRATQAARRASAEKIPKRKRLPPAERRAQILDAAARLVVQQGFLPLSTELLARAAGASKALVYAYFPTQYDLFNALIERELGGLASSGLDTASRVDNLDQAALLCGMLYFEYVAKSGPLLHILMSDRYMAGHHDRRLVHARNVIVHRLVLLTRGVLPLSKKEVLASIEMMMAIPEESGSLVFHDELQPAVAREICHSLMLSSLAALRAPDRVLGGANDVAGAVQHHRKA